VPYVLVRARYKLLSIQVLMIVCILSMYVIVHVAQVARPQESQHDLESSWAQPAGTKNADDWSATDSQEFKLKLRTAWPDSMTPTWHYAVVHHVVPVRILDVATSWLQLSHTGRQTVSY